MTVANIKSLAELEALRSDETGVVLNFAAEWCEPCAQMNDVFGTLAKRHAALRFVTVDVDAVREAVSAGLSLDARDGLGRTPLVVAVVHGRKRCVDVLLDGGADPETPSGHRSRPLAYAAFRGDAALCARLLGAGADPNKKAADGWTALHLPRRLFWRAPSLR